MLLLLKFAIISKIELLNTYLCMIFAPVSGTRRGQKANKNLMSKIADTHIVEIVIRQF